MGATAAILCDGEFPRTEYPRYLLSRADRLVVCDGALRKLLRASKRIFGGERLPDAVVGDMDSLSEALKKKYSGLIVHFPSQDDNDQTKAVRYVLENYPEVDEIYILGSTGLREDHTIGNLSLLMEYERMFPDKKAGIRAVSDYGTSFALTDSCTLQLGEGRRFSLFSPDNSLRIESEGLVWPTGEVVFDNWWKATLNRTCADSVTLRFSHPSLALVTVD